MVDERNNDNSLPEAETAREVDAPEASQAANASPDAEPVSVNSDRQAEAAGGAAEADSGAEQKTAEDKNAEDTTVNQADVAANDDQGQTSEATGGEEINEGMPVDSGDDDEAGPPSWYILKVQVNREDSIREALLRRVKIEGLEEYFLDVVVPTEDVVEFTKSGKRRVVKRKLYPGYILANMVINDETWFVVRETPGVGDFTGSAGTPTPMDPKDVERILRSSEPDEEGVAQPKTAIPFKPGERVRVKDGNFQNFEGEVESIDEAHGRVIVVIQIFSRPTPVELEHWQIEAV